MKYSTRLISAAIVTMVSLSTNACSGPAMSENTLTKGDPVVDMHLSGNQFQNVTTMTIPSKTDATRVTQNASPVTLVWPKPILQALAAVPNKHFPVYAPTELPALPTGAVLRADARAGSGIDPLYHVDLSAIFSHRARHESPHGRTTQTRLILGSFGGVEEGSVENARKAMTNLRYEIGVVPQSRGEEIQLGGQEKATAYSLASSHSIQFRQGNWHIEVNAASAPLAFATQIATIVSTRTLPAADDGMILIDETKAGIAETTPAYVYWRRGSVLSYTMMNDSPLDAIRMACSMHQVAIRS